MNTNIPFFLYDIHTDDLPSISQTILNYSTSDSNRQKKPIDYVELLEQKTQEITQVKHSVVVRSKISALLLALQTIGIKRNHRVICSVYCHPFVPECIRYFEAEPIFVDIHPENLAMLPEKCEEILTKKAGKKDDRIKAIIVSHIGGMLCDMEPFYKIKDEYNIGIIEDISSSIWLKNTKGNFVGSDLRTDFTILSYLPSMKGKLFLAGAVLTNNAIFAEKCRTLRYHSYIGENANSGLFYDVIDMSLDHSVSIVSAHLAYLTCKQYAEQELRRKEIAKMYQEGLSDLEGVMLPQEKETNIYSLFIVRFNKGRDRIASQLKEAGIETMLHFIPINFLSYYKNKFELKVTQFPNALDVYQEALSLPIYLGMSDDDVTQVIQAIRNILKADKE
ncbi:hypothetical protein BBW65_02495 [Helicobacter enhydrae]|uniref:Aminotransferase DegT n=1 Tax=Helicobacter enhydrae TaxID=222136 RepID=A0A1B1U4W0_9HELI|nr:DegT/DnrJ/EryC1/StrS aminotransferase family protein [Helicobacter enhydrae]ANV97742.1 hypothetical protein BBW65_02495 [Helicobacter enhydrae]